ncbi:MAG TPA: S8 family serine peptidase [Dehalococcoidia bacterium]|nr:S8 family serine peptidase [Dehalococcoidia bacterium]
MWSSSVRLPFLAAAARANTGGSIVVARVARAGVLAALLAAFFAAPADRPALAQQTDTGGLQHVLINLRVPEAHGPGISDRALVREKVRAAQERVLASPEAAPLQLAYRYQLLPALAGSMPVQAVTSLARHPDVASIELDRQGHGALLQSVPLINADDVHTAGYTGSGVVVAVIDTGVNTSHPDLADSLIYQECFMASPSLASRCPDGTTHQVGAGAAQDDQGHGTNVTGIIASNGTVAPIGVAPDVQIEAFKIIDVNNTFWFTDLYAALDAIEADHPEVDFINMSLGSFALYPPGSCDGFVDAFFLDGLRAQGTLSFAASMNNGSKTSMASPACVSSAISVGAAYDADIGPFTFICSDSTTAADKVACWSNSDSSLDLLGPGCSITSTGLFGPMSSFCGTSQATPHAVGVAALLLGATPGLSPAQVEHTLEATGVPLTDPANGITRPRVNALAALDIDSDGLLNPADPDDDNDGVADELEFACGADSLNAGIRPERLDGAFAGVDDDGDTQVDEALPPGAVGSDCDGDGYKGSAESGNPLCGNGKNDDDKSYPAYPGPLVADDGVVDDGCPGGPAQVGAFSEAQFNVGLTDQDPCGTNGWPSDFASGGVPNSTNRINVLDLTSFLAPVRRLDTSPGHPNFNARWDLTPGHGFFPNWIVVDDLTALLAGPSGNPPMIGGVRAFGGPACPWPP